MQSGTRNVFDWTWGNAIFMEYFAVVLVLA